MSIEAIAAAIRDVPDFPKPGIIFKDISPILENPDLFAEVIDRLAGAWDGKGIEAVAAVDARGFLFGAAVAYKLHTSLITVRKKGKLPRDTVAVKYDLEYGSNTLEIHADAVKPGGKVLVIDDLLATGGTVRAAIELIEKLGGKVAGVEFLMELCFLNGRAQLDGYQVHSLVKVD